MTPDEKILEEYRQVFRRYAADGIIDLDRRLRHKFSFQIVRLEELMDGMNGLLPPVRLSQYFVSFLKKGHGEKTVGRFSFPLREKTLFVIPTRTVHSSRYDPVPFAGYFVSFNLDFFLETIFPKKYLLEKPLFKVDTVPYVVLNDDQAAHVTDIFENLVDEFHATRTNRCELLAVKTLELLILCDRYFAASGNPPPVELLNHVVEKFHDLLQRQFMEHKSVSFYAGALHVHANYLNSLVKKHTGITAKRTIDERVMLEAKTLLRNPALSIKEIAYQLGFDEPDRFSSFFQRHLHTSPGRYRQRHLI